MRGSLGLQSQMYPSTQPSPSPLPTKYISSIKVEINTSISCRVPSLLPALNGILSTLSSPLDGTTVSLLIFRKDHYLERGYQSSKRGRKASLRSHHDDKIQPNWKPNGHKRPNWYNWCLERNQSFGCLSKRMGYHSLCVL